MILLLDNYDSFAHNLARYFRQLRQRVNVYRNDAISCSQIAEIAPDAIVLSPGPCTPNQAGVCLEVVKQLGPNIPILGVCLGHQAICQAYGAEIVKTSPVHGQAFQVQHSNHCLFNNIDNSFNAGRYHSLIMSPASVPHSLDIIANTSLNNRGDEVPMAVAHHSNPVFGVQFHPESILTSCGYQLLANFLMIAGIEVDQSLVDELNTEFHDQFETPANGDNITIPCNNSTWMGVMIWETIVTTRNPDGSPNIAPMGPECPEDNLFESFELRPFTSSTTYKNLKKAPTGCCAYLRRCFVVRHSGRSWLHRWMENNSRNDSRCAMPG